MLKIKEACFFLGHGVLTHYYTSFHAHYCSTSRKKWNFR